MLRAGGRALIYQMFATSLLEPGEAGVPSYWIVNPDPPQPELAVFELRDGRYALAAATPAPFSADRPFTVTIDPGRLTMGLRH